MNPWRKREFKLAIEIAIRDYIARALLAAHSANAEQWDRNLIVYGAVK